MSAKIQLGPSEWVVGGQLPTVQENLQTRHARRNHAKVQVDLCPDVPVHRQPGGIFSGQGATQVDDPHDCEDAGWELKGKGRDGLDLPRHPHLQRRDEDDG